MDRPRPLLRCRPSTGIGNTVLLALLSVTFAAMCVSPPRPLAPWEVELQWALSIGCAVVALGAYLWLGTVFLEVSEWGLRYWSLGRRWERAWTAVTDYYRTAPDPSRGQVSGARRAVIVLGDDKVALNEGEWTRMERLRELVQKHACQAAVSAWQTAGTRRQDAWPRTFQYPVGKLLLQTAIPLAMCSGAFGWFAWRTAVRVLADGPESPVALMAGGVMLLLIGAYSALPLMSLSWALQAWKRRDERIVVDLEGIALLDGFRRTRLRWEEVTDFGTQGGPDRFRPSVFHLSGRSGTIRFFHMLEDYRVLKEIVAKYAVNAAGCDWRLPREETFAFQRPREVGEGARLYHYRTRTVRAVLLLGLGFAAAPALQSGLIYSGLLQDRDPVSGLILSGALGLGVLAGWLFTQTSWVAVDEFGLTQKRLFWRRALSWSSIKEVRRTETSGVRLTGECSGQPVRLSCDSLLGGIDELADEIRRRVQAGEWRDSKDG